MIENKDYSDSFCTLHYRESVRRYCGVKEDGDLRYSAKGKKIKEQLVKCIWSEQLFKKDKLYTEDGLRMAVISSGLWNLEEGPDFKDAEILLEGKGVVKGTLKYMSVRVTGYAMGTVNKRSMKVYACTSLCGMTGRINILN